MLSSLQGQNPADLARVRKSHCGGQQIRKHYTATRRGGFWGRGGWDFGWQSWCLARGDPMGPPKSGGGGGFVRGGLLITHRVRGEVYQ